jgi:hypothetical protein
VEEAVDVRRGGDLVARKGLLRDAGAADDAAPLEHQDALPGAREVARGHQPVVAGADHDGVIARRAQRHAAIVPTEPIKRPWEAVP